MSAQCEGVIETYLRERVEAAGGECVKFLPAVKGNPDRIVILNAQVVFVELKAPGEQPEPHQIVRHRNMREAGAEVYIIDTKHGVDALVDALVLRESTDAYTRAAASEDPRHRTTLPSFTVLATGDDHQIAGSG